MVDALNQGLSVEYDITKTGEENLAIYTDQKDQLDKDDYENFLCPPAVKQVDEEKTDQTI